MKLKLERFHFGTVATIGRLFMDGKFFCYILEDVVREVPGEPVESWKVPGQTAIPRGTYRVTYGWSNRFQTFLPRVQDVPGYLGILIHPGNAAKDTEGCLLPGMSYDANADTVQRSREAFNNFMEKFKPATEGGQSVELEIV
jgi:hypothetical protein